MLSVVDDVSVDSKAYVVISSTSRFFLTDNGGSRSPPDFCISYWP